jgi:hypothetical protein
MRCRVLVSIEILSGGGAMLVSKENSQRRTEICESIMLHMLCRIEIEKALVSMTLSLQCNDLRGCIITQPARRARNAAL